MELVLINGIFLGISVNRACHSHQPLKPPPDSELVGSEAGQLEMNQIRSDQISRSVVFDSLRPHESQHARPPGPSPTPGVHSNSCPSSQ